MLDPLLQTIPGGGMNTVFLLVALTLLTLAPAILILMTSFTRIVVVLSFVRSGLATQQIPPNQVLVGLALFMTLFVMAPTFQEVIDTALVPYNEGALTLDEALIKASEPLKRFMAQSTRQKDLQMFLSYAGEKRPERIEDIPLRALVPAFVISELSTAFQMGFMIYLPFIVIDLVVASLLMGMGMMMLPPVMISLPFKILLFVLVDGWNLVVWTLLRSLPYGASG
ncbi:MAG: flagellar type III secretion system pore protein FliP [Candidatus Carbobacillus sp.]|nr:flagellar type III secretion system pore protein FliP [Candidatus Carbobacillus sp.]